MFSPARRCSSMRRQNMNNPKYYNPGKFKEKKENSGTEARKWVFDDTKRRFSEKDYYFSTGIHQTISDDDCNDEALQSTVENFNFESIPEGEWFPKGEKRIFDADPAVCIVNNDCIDVTRALTDLYKEDKVAMLNMANSVQPGGHYLLGQLAQEESIFYRTNIYKFLDPENMSGEDDFVHKHYPLSNVGGLYVPNVLAIRRSESSSYALCEAFHINVICVAGLDMRYSGAYFHDTHGVVIKNKIRSIFRIAIEKGQTILVLGALGCGAFNNNPRIVAGFFKEVIQETKANSTNFTFESIIGNNQKFENEISEKIKSTYLGFLMQPTHSSSQPPMAPLSTTPSPMSTPGISTPSAAATPTQFPPFNCPWSPQANLVRSDSSLPSRPSGLVNSASISPQNYPPPQQFAYPFTQNTNPISPDFGTQFNPNQTNMGYAQSTNWTTLPVPGFYYPNNNNTNDIVITLNQGPSPSNL